MSTGAATLHVKPRGRQCSHRWYLLTCEDYDALRARAQGRCEICRTEPATKARKTRPKEGKTDG